MADRDLQPAYVLHSRRFRESSLVVELLTPQHGRCAVLAKGAMGPRKSRQGSLQPFTPLLVAWKGRGELPLLTHCEPASPGPVLQGRALYCGIYVNELIQRLCERNDPHSKLFPAYAACINALATAAPDNQGLEPVLRHFELALLEDLGLGMQLQQDQEGKPIDPGQRYHYLADAGPVPTEDTAGSYSGSTLLFLALGHPGTPTQRAEARRLMRGMLDIHLGGRPLRSRELFQ